MWDMVSIILIAEVVAIGVYSIYAAIAYKNYRKKKWHN